MEDNKFSKMSDEEILKQSKTIKMLTSILGGALVALFIVNIMLAFKKGFSALSIMPIALLPIFIININSLKEIKKELKLRNLS